MQSTQTQYQPDIRNVVRLGRKDKDLKRLIKVTFVNEVSVKIIMAGHRQCIKQNIDWSITEDLSELMKYLPNFRNVFHSEDLVCDQSYQRKQERK